MSRLMDNPEISADELLAIELWLGNWLLVMVPSVTAEDLPDGLADSRVCFISLLSNLSLMISDNGFFILESA